MASEMMNRPLRGQIVPAWSPFFRSQLGLFLGLGFSSAASLAGYVPGLLPTQKMLIAGFFFGLSLAAFVYAVLHLRSAGKRREPVSRRERMVLAPVIVSVVAVFLARCWLFFHGG